MTVDFLPFRCQHCNLSFCGEHYVPELHNCSKYDASKYNRIAPSCPLCNTPVAVPPGQDPNIRMEAHISSECSVMTGKSQKKSTPVCARAKCGKVLFAPIRCDKCNQQFCPQHRFSATHACVPTGSKAGGSAASRPFADIQARTATASSAAVSAIQRAMASTPSSSSPTAVGLARPPPLAKSSSSSSSASSMPNPFSQTDRSVASPPSIPSALPDANATNSNEPPKLSATPITTVPKSSPLNYLSFRPPPVFATA